jgi:integrase
MHQPWIVFQRPDGGKKGKVYYAEFWDEAKRKYVGRSSTRKTSEAAARVQVEEWLADGAIPTTMEGETLAGFLAGFWQDDSMYLELKKEHGRHMSALYVHNSRRGIEKYVVPFLKKKGQENLLLTATKTGIIEELKLHLSKRGLGPARVNGILKSVKVALGEAWRLGKIRENPAARVERLLDRPDERLILEIEEVKRFFSLPWKDFRFYAANLLTATAGLRLGEIRGLQHEDVRDGFVHVVHNWQDLEGLKPPKWGSIRDVPLLRETEKALRQLMADNPWEGETFVFYGYTPGAPPSSTLFREHYDAALRALGITKEEQRRRNLTFHGWRHWYNSMMRGKIDDYALRKLTGHSSAAMTEKYTAPITSEQRKVIGAVVENVVGGLTK